MKELKKVTSMLGTVLTKEEIEEFRERDIRGLGAVLKGMKFPQLPLVNLLLQCRLLYLPFYSQSQKTYLHR